MLPMRTRFARREDPGLAPNEFAILKGLSTPQQTQALLNAIPSNHEPGGETILSVRAALRHYPLISPRRAARRTPKTNSRVSLQ